MRTVRPKALQGKKIMMALTMKNMLRLSSRRTGLACVLHLQRRLPRLINPQKSGTRTSSHGATNSRPADDQQQVQEDCVYADVAVNTEPESLAVGPSTSPGSPPAYSAEPDPMTAEHAPGKVHPRGLVGGIDDRYDAIVQSTGIRCTVLEHELNNKRSEVSAKGKSKALHRSV